MWFYNEEMNEEKIKSEENFTIFFTINRRTCFFLGKYVQMRKLSEVLLRFYVFLRFFFGFFGHERQKKRSKINLVHIFLNPHFFSEKIGDGKAPSDAHKIKKLIKKTKQKQKKRVILNIWILLEKSEIYQIPNFSKNIPLRNENNMYFTISWYLSIENNIVILSPIFFDV